MKKTLLALLVISFFTSCMSRHHRYRISHIGSRSSAPAYGNFSSKRSDKGGNGENEKVTQRVVIYNAYLSVEVKNSDSLNNQLTRLANKYEGYVLSIGTEKSVIRVKSVFLAEAISGITNSGKITRKTISGEDVTEEFYDSKVRLDNAHKARLRYLELLAKAENVDAALKVEKELERINREIDVLEGKIKRMEHLSEYSTITVNMEKKVKPGILGYVFVGLYKGVKWLFVRG